MIGLLSIIALGFFLGMRHATDPDHVIAITTIVSRQRSAWHAAVVGAVWGIGHTITILCVGCGILLLNWVIPARIGLSMELSVGVMLIFLGGWNLAAIVPSFQQALGQARSSLSQVESPEGGHVHSHSNTEGGPGHTHAHGHSSTEDSETHSHSIEDSSLGWLDRSLGSMSVYQILRPLIVGIVHGLAGSAAVALLVLATIQNVRWAVLYLLVFGLGTVVGMMLITVAIALPFVHTKRSTRFERGLRVASGLISLAFGFFLVYQIGFVDGLFGGNPQWTPR